MYTSCGWFFDDISGIETVQVVQYAARAVQLAQELFGDSLEEKLLAGLERAKSNVPLHQDGRHIYETLIRPSMVDLTKVAAHFAVSSLFEEYSNHSHIYSYSIDSEDYQPFEAGRYRLVVGRVRVSHQFIPDSATLEFAVLHLGDHNLNADVREHRDRASYHAMVQELSETFARSEFPKVVRVMDHRFGESSFSLRSLFRDEQRRVLGQILESTLSGVETVYRQQYESNYPMVRFLIDLGIPIPEALHTPVEFVVNADLQAALTQDELDPERVRNLLEEARLCNLHLDTEGLGLLFQRNMENKMGRLSASPGDGATLERLVEAARLTKEFPFEVTLSKVQNLYYAMLQTAYPEFLEKARRGNAAARNWVDQFVALGDLLSVRVP